MQDRERGTITTIAHKYISYTYRRNFRECRPTRENIIIKHRDNFHVVYNAIHGESLATRSIYLLITQTVNHGQLS